MRGSDALAYAKVVWIDAVPTVSKGSLGVPCLQRWSAFVVADGVCLRRAEKDSGTIPPGTSMGQPGVWWSFGLTRTRDGLPKTPGLLSLQRLPTHCRRTLEISHAR